MSAATTTPAGAPPLALAAWRTVLAPHARPRLARSVLDLATSVVPFLALWVAMDRALGVSYALVLALALPAAGFLLRTYILFHDCTHGSFLASERANAWLGRFLGLLVLTPYGAWRASHAIHHATAGDLDHRGTGDVQTLTVAEFAALAPRARRAYRLFRNPFVMFVLGPIWALVVQPRRFERDDRPRIKRSVMTTNAALALVVALLAWLVGPLDLLLVEAPLVLLAGSAGVFLFYVQHQFEDVYWRESSGWSFADAALQGSSHLRLPKVLQFFTGNIGLHHVHHLNARIPNYALQAAHDATPAFAAVPTLTLRQAFACTRLKLYDEERGRLVGWDEVPAV